MKEERNCQPADKKKKTTEKKNTLKPILKFIAPYWKKGIIPVLFLLTSTVISFFYPLFSKWAVDSVVVEKNINKLLPLAVTFLVLIVLQRLFSYLNEITFFKFQKESILGIQLDLIRKVFYYPLDFFDRNHSGYLLGRIRGDVAGLSYIFSESLVMVLMDFVKFFGIFVILLTMNVKLTLISISVLPFLVFKILGSKAGIKEINEKILEENARLTRKLSDTLQGIEVLKSFSKEEEGIKLAGEGLTEYQKIEVKRNVVISKYRNIMELIVNIGQVLLLYFGIREVILGHLTLGGYMAFSAYLLSLYSPVRNLSSLNIFLDFAKRSYTRLKELLDILPEDSGDVEVDGINRIEVKKLGFSYNGSDGVIKDLDFVIKRGEKVLIEGESGSGKSTLIKLLLGLYRPGEGEVKYNGTDLKKIDLKKLREKVGYISQDTFLFNKTIRENLTLGCPEISDDDLLRLLEECKLAKRIKGFEKGLDEEISERGVNFSGGEGQRIALTRALIKKPGIIIIDEGTSNLDIETEDDIVKQIEKKFNDKIIIRVTHRKVEGNGWRRIALSS